MFRAFVFGILTTIVIAVVGGYFVLRNGIILANADATPGWIETWAAGTSLDATLHREAQGTNPVSMTDENLIAAIKLYGQHCAICHGTAKGEASASPVAKGLYPRPPQLAIDGVEDDPERFLLLEDQTWHPVARCAVLEVDINRPADLVPCSVPQAYGQPSPRR